jgi:hypothetical protein
MCRDVGVRAPAQRPSRDISQAVVEALLRDHVRGVDGKKQDISVLGHIVPLVQAQMKAYGLIEHFADQRASNFT